VIEVVPGKRSGVLILKGTCVQADSIVENYESGSPIDEIANNFDVPDTTIRTVLSYAENKRKPLKG